MRFVFPPSPGKLLRYSKKPAEWPLAVRLTLFAAPLCMCLILGAAWFGYRSSSAALKESLESLPLLEAKIQAATLGETLSRIRDRLMGIAQEPDLNAHVLRNSLTDIFRSEADLVYEFSYKDAQGDGFMLLRDNGGFSLMSAAEAGQGPYSPFQQALESPPQPGRVTLFAPAYFDEANAGGQERRAPVMRLGIALPENRGLIILGVNMAKLRDRLAAFMLPDSSLKTPQQEGALQLAFFFDTRGWILFEMDSTGSPSYQPDMARTGYTGDFGRAGFDSAFRPWAQHENYWRMVTEAGLGRAGSIPAPADKYTAAPNVATTGLLCFAPVFFSPAPGLPPQVMGGIAFFETSPLPLNAFLSLANYTLVILVAAIVFFGLLAYGVNRTIAAPMRRMAVDLGSMASRGVLDFVDVTPGCEEQQLCQSAVNGLIAMSMSTRNELDLLSREMLQAKSRLPVDLSRPASPEAKAEFDLIGSSALIREVRDHVRKAARAGTDVLVWGETGTGKELVAAAIHRASPKNSGPYISINCGALDENLLLDALFGHVRGAFTEAKADRKGAFLAADGGTLHLDEIANASPKVQQALLRALSVRRIRPLGTDREVPFTTRVVAATNVDLRECVRADTFREDLYYRLAIISIETPPLRHRKEDIPELAAFCIKDAAAALGRPEAKLSRGALELMMAHNWPGNVREFKNCITRAMAYVEGDIILRQHITLEQDAFRTYAKPIAPQVLAGIMHNAESRTGSDGALASGPSARRGRQRSEAEAAPSQEAPPGGETRVDDFPATYIWPAPSRDLFTPARQEDDHAAGQARIDQMLGGLPEDAPPAHAASRAGGNGKASAASAGLNERQIIALDYVRRHGEMSRAEYENVAGASLSARTAQNDLRELVERGILVRVGAGPGTRYTEAGAAGTEKSA